MFQMLFSPGKINTLELKNRVIMTAMHLNYTPGGKANDRLIRFYEERARYEVAMAIVGGCAIDEFSGSPDMINLKDDEDMEGLSRLTEAVHRAGGRLCAQLYHGGAYVHSLFLKGKKAISPSGVFSRFTKETPRALANDEIPWVVDNFAQGAKRAKVAGFDSVEILASAGYLISQFLSPLTNKRQDEYGGPLENRMRFGLEVARAVRAAVGRDYPVICR
ncbi:MAG: oxidoreductase, partial [Thermodesulfobacteriota bacterium]